MTQQQAPVVAVLGTGAMGRGLASRPAQTGHMVRAWNRTPAKAQLGEPGITLCETPAAAVDHATHVLLVLADDAAVEDAAVEEVMSGPLGTGMNIKLTLNLLLGLEMQALAEVIALGETPGIDRSDLLDTVRGSGFSAPVMGFKSLRTAVACQAHLAACAAGWADYDCAVIADALTHDPVPETVS